MSKHVVNSLAALVIGVALRFVVNLEPLWWLAWFVPGLLLALALRVENAASRIFIAIAAAVGVTVNVPYFLSVMPAPVMLLVMVLQTLLWLFIIGSARRVMRASGSAWTILALPVIGVAVDTLLAHLTPDGNWGSLAYTQADVLPVAQLASVFGMGGVLFLLLLVNSAVAMALHRGLRSRDVRVTCGLVAMLLVVAAALGFWRLQGESSGQRMAFGIVSIDDFIAGGASARSEEVWSQYQAQIAALAKDGAKIVLLPEKISVLPAADAEALKNRLGGIARDNHIWMVAGLGVDDGQQRRNEAWWFAPDGQLVTTYLKHFMAPPEREFVPGNEFPINAIEGVNYGVAICKDMHFASLGRRFGQRDAAVMLVPAWDFHRDARMAASMTRMRGIESGFAVVRSSRDGLLSVSDARGRVLSVVDSAAMPGASLSVSAPVGARIPTIYTRIGDLLGWVCVAGMLLCVPWSLWKRRRVMPTS